MTEVQIEEEFNRSDEAYDAISDILDEGEFQNGEILIAIGMLVAEFVRNNDDCPIEEIVNLLKDVALDYLKKMSDA